MVIDITQNDQGDVSIYRVGFLSYDGFRTLMVFNTRTENYPGSALLQASEFCSFLNGGVKPEWM